MPLDIMLLEERIVLDGAAGEVLADQAADNDAGASQADAGQQNGSAIPGRGQADADVHVLVVSSDVENVETLVSAALEDVVTVVYDADTDSAEQILAAIQASLDGQKADSIAFATHSLGAGNLYLTQDLTVNAGTMLTDSDAVGFWESVGAMLEDDGRIDLLSCDLAASDEGALLISQIEEASGADVAASTDDTGNEADGGDWILEDGGIDVAQVYFDPDGLAEYTGLLASESKVTATDGAAGDSLGCSISISGNYMIVGAYSDDDGGDSSGSAYIYYYDGSSWTQQAKLVADDAAASDYFGYSVSISGNYAVVGAYGEDGSGTDLGAAYIFYYDGSSWTQQAKLTAGDAAADDYFGYSVSVSGDYAIIGAHGDDDVPSNSGSAYIFYRSGTSWTQQAKLVSDDASTGDEFGYSVAISGDDVIIGARSGDGDVNNSGVAYIFTRSGASWSQQAKLEASDAATSDRFGCSVSISGDYAIVGACHDGDGGLYSGSAYIFYRSGTSWTQQAKLVADDASSPASFGNSVSILGDSAVVGAYYGNGADTNSGSAYVFSRSGTSWTQQTELNASDGETGECFGYCVATTGSTVVVGVLGDDDKGTDSGAAFIYSFNNAPTASNLDQTHTINEDSGALDLTNIVVADADGDNVTATLTLSAAAAGSLSATSGHGEAYTAGTGVWTVTGTVADVNAALAALAFTPAANYDQNVTIAATVADTKGGSVSNTITINITAVEDAVSATNLTRTVAYTEDAASVDLSGIVVTDPDTGDQITATLTLADPSAGSLSTSGSASYTAGTGVWTITGTVAEVNAALASVAFTPTANYSADTTIAVRIEDGLEAGSAQTGTITLDCTPVNDAPGATNLNQNLAYAEGAASVAITDIVVSDADVNEQIKATLTLADTSTGSLSANDGASYTSSTGVWTITGTVAQVNTALANLVFNPATDNDTDTTVSVNIEDGKEDGVAALTGTISLQLSGTDNDQPSATNLTKTVTYNEGANSVALDDIVVTDPDTGEQIIATLTLANTSAGSLTANDGAAYNAGTGQWSITGTVAQVNAALAGVAFTPAANNDQNTTIAVSIADGGENGSQAQTGTITLNATPVNDQPTATHLDQTKTYTEGDNSVALGDIVVSDVDTGEQIKATLTLADTSAGSLSQNDGASYNSSTGAWTITGTVAQVNTALANLVFNPAANNDSDTTISVNIEDGKEDGAAALTGTINLQLSGTDNDQPSATNLTKTVTYNEGANSVALDDIVVTDPDTGEQIIATLTLANTSAGSLTANDGAAYNAGTGQWTITGTVAQVNAALAGVAFVPLAENNADTTIAVSIADGGENGSQAQTGTITLNATPVNDQPSATNLTKTVTYNEGANSVALDDIVVTDVDTNEQITATLTLADTSAGSLSENNGASYNSSTGVWAITGTVAQVNTALAGVAFVPGADNDRSTTIAVEIADGRENGATALAGTINLSCTPAQGGTDDNGSTGGDDGSTGEDNGSTGGDDGSTGQETPDDVVFVPDPTVDTGSSDSSDSGLSGSQADTNPVDNSGADVGPDAGTESGAGASGLDSSAMASVEADAVMESASGEFNGPDADADLQQVTDALQTSSLNAYDGPGGANADLNQVLRALGDASSSVSNDFAQVADTLTLDTGLQTAAVETAAPSSNVQAQAPGSSTPADAGRGDTTFRDAGMAEDPIIRGATILDGEVKSLSFSGSNPDFSAQSLESAVNKLLQLTQEMHTSKGYQARVMLSETAAELSEIVERTAERGGDVEELKEKMNNIQQMLNK